MFYCINNAYGPTSTLQIGCNRYVRSISTQSPYFSTHHVLTPMFFVGWKLLIADWLINRSTSLHSLIGNLFMESIYVFVYIHHTCADLLFSGHTATYVLLTLFWTHYSRGEEWKLCGMSQLHSTTLKSQSINQKFPTCIHSDDRSIDLTHPLMSFPPVLCRLYSCSSWSTCWRWSWWSIRMPLVIFLCVGILLCWLVFHFADTVSLLLWCFHCILLDIIGISFISLLREELPGTKDT